VNFVVRHTNFFCAGIVLVLNLINVTKIISLNTRIHLSQNIGCPLGPSIFDVGNWEGRGVKNWSKLPTSTAKKNCRYGEGGGGGGCQISGKIADIVYK
jgi:hypothetical protein